MALLQYMLKKQGMEYHRFLKKELIWLNSVDSGEQQ